MAMQQMTEEASPARQPGWCAHLDLKYAHAGGRTLLRHEHFGPLRVQRPFFPEGEVNHTYLLHPPGGLVGDDVLTIAAEVAPGAHGLVTTPGATKAYRNVCRGASLRQRFDVRGTFEYLPQETILFDGSRLESLSEIRLGDRARFISWEVVCLGRPCGSHPYTQGSAEFRTAIHTPGGLLFDDRLKIGGEADLLDAAWGLQGCPVSGVMLAYPADTAVLDAARNRLASHGSGLAATLIDGLMVVRALKPQAQAVKKAFGDVWRGIRPLVVDKQACAPRIWST